MNHGPAEMYRAVLEGVAFNLRLILDALSSHQPIRALRLIGGGARSAIWPRILADVLGRPLEMLEMTAEATSWGQPWPAELALASTQTGASLRTTPV